MTTQSDGRTERPMTMQELRATLPGEIAKGHNCATCGAPAAAHKIRGGFCPWMPTYRAPIASDAAVDRATQFAYPLIQNAAWTEDGTRALVQGILRAAGRSANA